MSRATLLVLFYCLAALLPMSSSANDDWELSSHKSIDLFSSEFIRHLHVSAKYSFRGKKELYSKFGKAKSPYDAKVKDRTEEPFQVYSWLEGYRKKVIRSRLFVCNYVDPNKSRGTKPLLFVLR